MSKIPDATAVAPPQRRASKMRAFRLFEDVYPDALAYAREDGGLSHVVNTLLASYVESKRAAEKPARRRAKPKPEHDPFA